MARSFILRAALAGPVALAPSLLMAQAAPGPADVVAQALPAVVAVEAAGIPAADPGLVGRLGEDARRDVDRLFGRPDDAPALAEVASGFVIDPGGLVLTSARAVGGATRLAVVLDDGRVLDAQLVGRDVPTDVAVLRVQASDLPAVTWGDPGALRLGDAVMALGRTGDGGVVTRGVLSSLGRDADPARDGRILEVDARIDAENGGGPLVDDAGRVVGMADQAMALGGAGDGLGLAVPAGVLRAVAADLVADGAVARGWLGVRIGDMTPEAAQALGLDAPRGAVVSGVQPGGPAAVAGLRPGDVVLTVDGAPVGDARDLSRTVAASAPGTQAELTVLRDGSEAQVDVTLGDLADRGA